MSDASTGAHESFCGLNEGFAHLGYGAIRRLLFKVFAKANGAGGWVLAVIYEVLVYLSYCNKDMKYADMNQDMAFRAAL